MADSLAIDEADFLAGWHAALVEMRDDDGRQFLLEMARRGLAVAEARVPRGATGELAAALGMEAGEDEGGPYVEFGVMGGGHANEVGFYMEFGTYKDRARGFMRAALAELGGVVATLGGRAIRGGSVRSRGIELRARKRSTIRQFRRRGVSAAEARAASRSVSSKFQIRTRQGRSWISNTRIRGR